MSKTNQINNKKQWIGKNQQNKNKYQMNILMKQKENIVNHIREEIHWDSPETKHFLPSPKEDLENKRKAIN